MSYLSGQILMGGFEGQTLPAGTRERLASGHLAGVILMGRNVRDPQQVRSLLGEVITASGQDLLPLTAVDQEGGRVARLKPPLVTLPPARSFGDRDDTQLTYDAALVLAQQLQALGFSVDFAPCLDVDGAAPKAIIGDRSFSADPSRVARHGQAFVRAFLSCGVAVSAKHFPGHGCTTHDSHYELPYVDATAEELEQSDLIPFRMAVRAGVPLFMTAHVVYRALDSLPATCSRRILNDLLRGQMGYNGVVVTDDLTMGAVEALGGPEEVALAALVAGADLLLVCHQEDLQERVRERVEAEARRSKAFASRLEEAAMRVRRLRETFPPNPAQDIQPVIHSQMAADVTTQLAALLGD